ncbi:MAG: hypothetical protein JO340_07730 [Acidobacteriaceae bacterium]|nr:hypothetical protein [Acidobacteriaceae bacterium]
MPLMQYSPFASLQNLARQRDAREPCELCGAGLSSAHQHLIEPATRKLLCACEACALLFDSPTRTNYKRVPRRLRQLTRFQITDGEWDSLAIPIGVAFFFQSSPQNATVVIYPSPAGATESHLSFESWRDIAERNSALARMEPDVEGLLVNRLGLPRAAAEYYIAPIDRCYELVGTLRAHWRGLSGGAAVWERVGRFFEQLRSQAALEPTHA